MDADDQCPASLRNIDSGTADLQSYQEENIGATGNNFIGAAPEHPVIVAALEKSVGAIKRGDSDLLWLSAGPGLLTRQVAAYLVGDLKPRLGKTVILRSFEIEKSIAVWTLASYKHTQKHWSRTTFGRAHDLLRNVSASMQSVSPSLSEVTSGLARGNLS